MLMMPPVKASGARIRKRSSPDFQPKPRATRVFIRSTRPWVRAMPLGTPVVPEV